MRTVLLLLVFWLPPALADLFEHGLWEEVLVEFVDADGFVDYEGLALAREDLDAYLALIAGAGPTLTPEQFTTPDDELAYYINAYNALVFKGVLDRGPEKRSVWRGLISGLKFFVLMDVFLDGQTTSLKKLEDDIIREKYQDPRIHAAINCASISCPRLRRSAFTGDQLQQQLDASIREFVTDPRHVRHKDNVVYVSSIFDWFEEDFIAGSYYYEQPQALGNKKSGLAIIEFINQYRDVAIPNDAIVKFTDYDKAINAQR